jgi:hypothetical protein
MKQAATKDFDDEYSNTLGRSVFVATLRYRGKDCMRTEEVRVLELGERAAVVASAIAFCHGEVVQLSVVVGGRAIRQLAQVQACRLEPARPMWLVKLKVLAVAKPDRPQLGVHSRMTPRRESESLRKTRQALYGGSRSEAGRSR